MEKSQREIENSMSVDCIDSTVRLSQYNKKYEGAEQLIKKLEDDGRILDIATKEKIKKTWVLIGEIIHEIK